MQSEVGFGICKQCWHPYDSPVVKFCGYCCAKQEGPQQATEHVADNNSSLARCSSVMCNKMADSQETGYNNGHCRRCQHKEKVIAAARAVFCHLPRGVTGQAATKWLSAFTADLEGEKAARFPTDITTLATHQALDRALFEQLNQCSLARKGAMNVIERNGGSDGGGVVSGITEDRTTRERTFLVDDAPEQTPWWTDYVPWTVVSVLAVALAITTRYRQS